MVKIVGIDQNIIYYNSHGQNNIANSSIVNTFEAVKMLKEKSNNPEVLKLLNDHYADKMMLKIFKDQNHNFEIDKARIYQRRAINIMKYFLEKHNQGMGLFLEQRTGKTPTMAMFLEENKDKLKNNILICNSANQHDIIAQFEKFAPSFKIFKLFKITAKNKVSAYKPEDRLKVFQEFSEYDNNKIIISSPATLKIDFNLDIFKKEGKKHYLIDNIDAFMIDEGHFLSNHRSKQSKTISYLRRRAKYGYILTGTPAINNAWAFVNLVNFIRPKGQKIDKFLVLEYFYKKESKFISKKLSIDEFGEIKFEKEQEFANWLKTFCIQEKYQEVIDWYLEPKIFKVELSMLPKQQQHYTNMLETFKSMPKGSDRAKRAGTLIEQMIRLRQIAIDPELINCEGASNKTNYIIKWIKQYPDSPVIIFSDFTSYLNKLKKILIQEFQKPISMITGEQKSGEKHQAELDFQSGKTNIILCNLIAGSKGFTLDRSNHTIFINQSWNPTENKQASFRFMNTQDAGTNKNPVIINLVSKNSIEEYILEALENKNNLTSIINNFENYINQI